MAATRTGLHPSVMEGTHFMSFKAPDLTVAFGALFQDELKIYRIPSGCKVCSPGTRYFPVTGGADWVRRVSFRVGGF